MLIGKKSLIRISLWIAGFFVLLFCVLLLRGYQVEKEHERELALKLVFDDIYTVTFHNHVTGETHTVPLDEYIFHVVAGEMPLGYDIEALKAQVVAARTYTVRKCESICGTSKYSCKKGNWDVCTDSSCCQAWRSTEKMKLYWGRHYYEYSLKLYEAVSSTNGEILTYNGQPINAMYHSSSGGRTENIEDVYGGDPVPYLKAVESVGEEDFADYKSTVKVKYADAADKLNKALGTDLNPEEIRANVKILSATESGTVKSIKVGAKTASGRDFRRIFSLKSCNFTLSYDNRYVIIQVKGFGHGVGMSQTGAGAMARSGKTYSEILTHYYTGVKLTQIGDL